MIKSSVLGLKLLADLLHFLVLNLRSKSSLAAEHLLLGKQLAFCLLGSLVETSILRI
jgi:hypothetical protein